MNRRSILTLVVFAVAALIGPAQAADRFITVASTTSTQNSGLFRHLLPLFENKTGIAVRVVAVGTGQAIRLARRGDADVLLVHHRPSEEKFVADGHGVVRKNVMYNDFIVVGPAADPARVRGLKQAQVAFARIAASKSFFASRGDDSGTNKKELALWSGAGIDAKAASGTWYRETGSGMGATLNAAAAMGAYTLADRGTWISFRNRRSMDVLVEGDGHLFNQYGVILVNAVKHPHVKARDGQAFIDWLTGAAGQKAIAGFRLGGRQLFFSNAAPSG